MLTPLDRLVREQIHREGPMEYREVVELALYHPEHGFYTASGHAGRRGDFITSPEIGPLFGHVVANALDEEWDRLGQPNEFVVIDWGAGPGTLLRSIARAEPRCIAALRRVAVERSPSQREKHDSSHESVETLDVDMFVDRPGVVIANELLDNLAFTPVRRTRAGYVRELVDIDPESGSLIVIDGPLIDAAIDDMLSGEPERAVWQPEAAQWLNQACGTLRAGRVICFDYGRLHSGDVEIRTYESHGEAGHPLEALGTKDITVDVDFFQLQKAVKAADKAITQAEWLRDHGIHELVEDGRQRWRETKMTGSLEAMWARSRVRESEALLDPAGLGGFTTAEWTI